MASHGRTGEAHTMYLVRKSKPHKVSGVYTDEGGHRVVMTRKQRLHTLNRNASGKRERDYPLFKPYVCRGRFNERSD